MILTLLYVIHSIHAIYAVLVQCMPHAHGFVYLLIYLWYSRDCTIPFYSKSPVLQVQILLGFVNVTYTYFPLAFRMEQLKVRMGLRGLKDEQGFRLFLVKNHIHNLH